MSEFAVNVSTIQEPSAGSYSERLYNEDLAPLSLAGTESAADRSQNWTWYNIFAFWTADVHSVGGYVFAVACLPPDSPASRCWSACWRAFRLLNSSPTCSTGWTRGIRQRQSACCILACHVEGAAHMVEDYNRAAVGNIDVCIGTSGPAGIDMSAEFYSALGDSIRVLCITWQAAHATL